MKLCYLPLLLLFIVLKTNAQQKLTWHVGFNAGVILSKASYSGIKTYDNNYDPDLGQFWTGLKLWTGYKKLQIGIAAESGFVSAHTEYTVQVYVNNMPEGEDHNYETYKMFSPAISPLAFVHYKLSLPRGAYMYAGPVVGILSGKNEIENRNITAPLAGANLGIAIQIGKNVHLELAHGYRAGKVNIYNGTRTTHHAVNRYITYNINDFWLQSLSNTLGIAATF